MRNKLDIIVTGTGRCGTVTFAKLLNDLGIRCGHEAYFGLEFAKGNLDMSNVLDRKPEPSLISKLSLGTSVEKWFESEDITAECSYLIAPHINNSMFDGSKFIHLYRDPIKVINSYVVKFRYFGDKKSYYQNYIVKHLPYLKQLDNPVDKAAYFWCEWNKKIVNSGRNSLIVNIEQFSLQRVCSFLNVEYKPIPVSKSNARNNGKIVYGWDSISPSIRASVKELLSFLEMQGILLL